MPQTSARDQHKDEVCESKLIIIKISPPTVQIQLARKQLQNISNAQPNQQRLEELGSPIPNHFAYFKKNTVTKSPDCIPEV